MDAEKYLDYKLDGGYITYTEDGISRITGIEHSEMCEIMEGFLTETLAVLKEDIITAFDFTVSHMDEGEAKDRMIEFLKANS